MFTRSKRNSASDPRPAGNSSSPTEMPAGSPKKSRRNCASEILVTPSPTPMTPNRRRISGRSTKATANKYLPPDDSVPQEGHSHSRQNHRPITRAEAISLAKQRRNAEKVKEAAKQENELVMAKKREKDALLAAKFARELAGEANAELNKLNRAKERVPDVSSWSEAKREKNFVSDVKKSAKMNFPDKTGKQRYEKVLTLVEDGHFGKAGKKAYLSNVRKYTRSVLWHADERRRHR